MPLNKVVGESLAGMKTRPVVMPLEKWADTKFWDFAAQRADKSFGLSSSKTKSFRRRVRAVVKPFIWGPHEVSVQVYPYEKVPCVVFLFCKVINTKELYSWVTFQMTPQVINELRMAGRWPVAIEAAA